MLDLDQYFTQKSYKTLYHYTSIDALYGITNSRKLWASNAFVLNDSQEIIHACTILSDLLKQKIQNYSDQDRKCIFLKQFLDWIHTFNITQYNIFVFSLSEDSDLLSQWRSYTPHSKGVNIGFNFQNIYEIAKKNKLQVIKCIYDLEHTKEIINQMINDLVDKFENTISEYNVNKHHPSQCYYGFLESYRGDILQILAMFKNETFKEEKEWRLVSKYHPRYTIPEIKFRVGASLLIPYIELDIGNVEGIIEEVNIGPTPNVELSLNALLMFLSNKRICYSVGKSNSPYREWK